MPPKYRALFKSSSLALDLIFLINMTKTNEAIRPTNKTLTAAPANGSSPSIRVVRCRNQSFPDHALEQPTERFGGAPEDQRVRLHGSGLCPSGGIGQLQ